MLSIVIIYCKKDQPILQRCIKSLPKWAEIIIAETVPEKEWKINFVKEYGQIKRYIINYPEGWFRFDTARNLAKSVATQEWILSLDADEELVKNQEEWLKRLLETTPDDIGAYFSTQFGVVNVLHQRGVATRIATPIIRLSLIHI